MKTPQFSSLLAIIAKISVGLSAGLGLSVPANAEMLFICRNTSGLPSGLTVVIQNDPTTQLTEAVLTDRENLGPFVDLGKIPVTREPVPTDVMGAPITYVGQDFRLEIFWDGGPDGGGLHSHVYVDIGGRAYDEPMICSIPRPT